ncbi:MAG TPA: 50S ribosomal protein L3 [Candidatus Nanoarchaeia archaeon]|nr:large subunit ribosomal protein L3 [uncultured archaeon]HJX49981.1 50S ribosomal protein L3 [Candidatus Nanoarchaeia archaeon]
MAKISAPRKGSLQYWPRKRASKILPSVNWGTISSKKPLKGFICYKCGMATAITKDNTPDSMTKGKEIAMPITILECPTMKILSVRFYKNGITMKDIVSDNLDKELKRVIKIPKKAGKKIEDIKPEDYDDVTIIAYSQPKKTGVKKTPDIIEIGLQGSKEEKIKFIKENLSKELSVLDFFEKGGLVDLRGVTKGRGFQGPVKRFGIKLRHHKSEKGVRKVGSIGPWHPSRVTFRVPMAGQTGMNTRIVYNNKILEIGKSQGKFKNISNYGNVQADYMLIRGSVLGPAKRQLVLNSSARPTKKQLKKSFEIIKII